MGQGTKRRPNSCLLPKSQQATLAIIYIITLLSRVMTSDNYVWSGPRVTDFTMPMFREIYSIYSVKMK